MGKIIRMKKKDGHLIYIDSNCAKMCPKTELFSGPYLAIFGLNAGKYGPEKTPYLDSFQAASFMREVPII